MARPLDMEAALATYLTETLTAYAMPLPLDFDSHLPCALVTRTGGDTVSRVLNVHSVSVDVYAETWGEANEKASDVAGAIVGMVGATVGGKSVTETDCNVPYANPDPRHESVPRVTMTATITVRGL